MKTPRELKVTPIRNGTVIDHITANKALHVLKILNLPSQETAVTIGMNVKSSQMGAKDIVKIEGRELESAEVPVDSLFYVTCQEPLVVRCYFCERAMDQAEIEKQFGPL